TQRGAPRFPVSSFYCGQILRGLQEQPGYNFISCSPEAEKARILSYTHLPAILLLQASFCSSLFARLIQLYDRKKQPSARKREPKPAPRLLFHRNLDISPRIYSVNVGRIPVFAR